VSPRGRWDGPLFGIGANAGRAEFRHMDAQGRLIDPLAETETQRTERIRALQDLRVAAGPREAPPADPAGVMTEWTATVPGRVPRAHAEADESEAAFTTGLNLILLVAAIIALVSGVASLAAIRSRNFAQQQGPVSPAG
jgi:hypothetical protein